MGRVLGIVAIAKNFAIGKGGKLPWHYAEDLRFFKRLTTGNAVVMGFNTWLSLKKPLNDRLNIILSKSRSIKNQPGVLLMRSKEEILTLNKYLKCDLFIIGGASTYATFSEEIEQWFVTEIPLEPEDADTFMPTTFLHDFHLKENIQLDSDLSVKVYVRSTESIVK